MFGMNKRFKVMRNIRIYYFNLNLQLIIFSQIFANNGQTSFTIDKELFAALLKGYKLEDFITKENRFPGRKKNRKKRGD